MHLFWGINSAAIGMASRGLRTPIRSRVLSHFNESICASLQISLHVFMNQSLRPYAQLVAHVCDRSRTRVIEVSHTCARTIPPVWNDECVKMCRQNDKEGWKSR
jgi:hypothetical protein